MPFALQPNSALREPLYRRYFIATSQSTLATWMLRFPLGWMAWELTHSAFWVGVFGACLLLPAIVLAPVFGVVSDRINPRNGLLFTLGSHALIAALTAVGLFNNWLELFGLLSSALIIGLITAAHQPLRLAFIPRLVTRERLPSAIGISAIVYNTSRIVGPAIAGVIIAHSSAAVAIAVSALLFLGAVTALLRVHLLPLANGAGGQGVWAQMVEGLRFAKGNSAIRLILTLTMVNGLLGRSVLELLPAITGKLLAGGATQLAWLTGAAGAGSILGGLLLTRQSDQETALLRWVLVSLTASSLMLLPLRWLVSPWLLTFMVGLLSLSTTMAGIGSQALAQLSVVEQFRGRVMSLWTMMTMGAPAVGGFLLGALADLVGFIATLAGLGGVALLVVLRLWSKRALFSELGVAEHR
ncbi:MFS transporter [Halioxenophilus sp. WMMB6]|uniref:MFS transporter n=1 Tax=Halioxenophilus sp. WMMB6 TaxID=3073815 RepID=UPI00295F3A79|nr:MFS transporter [Halioxenophilus sp. WMMB6]